MNPLNKFFIPFFIFTISMSLFSQKYETHNYKTLFTDDSFEFSASVHTVVKSCTYNYV